MQEREEITELPTQFPEVSERIIVETTYRVDVFWQNPQRKFQAFVEFKNEEPALYRYVFNFARRKSNGEFFNSLAIALIMNRILTKAAQDQGCNLPPVSFDTVRLHKAEERLFKKGLNESLDFEERERQFLAENPELMFWIQFGLRPTMAKIAQIVYLLKRKQFESAQLKKQFGG